ncbi:MAG: hypothetical protein HY013_04630, partial [Candidatus Solibacter usitatus]|nr:hypothetical protein [Candidatus Solibacter usitatus]
MIGKRAMTTLAATGLALALATSAWAADCRKKIHLQATSAGMAGDLSGAAEVRARGAQQSLRVSMDARVPDGTTFVVKSGALTIGTVVISLGDGELDLNNKDGAVLPTGADPVCGVTSISVWDASGALV